MEDAETVRVLVPDKSAEQFLPITTLAEMPPDAKILADIPPVTCGNTHAIGAVAPSGILLFLLNAWNILRTWPFLFQLARVSDMEGPDKYLPADLLNTL
jgi:hypothetical protein